MRTFQEENDLLLNSFLNRTFFKSWKSSDEERNSNEIFYQNFSTVEFDINRICDLKCKYCYYNKFGSHYYPPGTEDKNKILAMVARQSGESGRQPNGPG